MTEDTSGGEDTRIIFRDSLTGQIVTEEWAEEHPAESEREEVPEGSDTANLIDLALAVDFAVATGQFEHDPEDILEYTPEEA